MVTEASIPEGNVPLYVKSINGKLLQVRSLQNETIAALKKRVGLAFAQDSGDEALVNESRLTLIFAGLKMQENLKLEDYAVQHHTQINAIWK